MPKKLQLDDLDAIGFGRTPTRGVANLAKDIVSGLKGLAALPQKAFESSETMRGGGPYDPGPIVGASALGPAMTAPRVLRGGADPDTLATLYMRQRATPPGRAPTSEAERKAIRTTYDLYDEKGKRRGYVQTSRPDEKTVYVENIGTFEDSRLPLGSVARKANPSSQAIGLKDMKSLLMGFREQFPEATTLAGYRVSGGRNAAGSVDSLIRNMSAYGNEPIINASMPIPKFTETQLKQYAAGRPPGVDPLSGLAPAPSAVRPAGGGGTVSYGNWQRRLPEGPHSLDLNQPGVLERELARTRAEPVRTTQPARPQPPSPSEEEARRALNAIMEALRVPRGGS